MDEETFELPLNELQLDTGETHYSTNWHGYAVKYTRPAWSKSGASRMSGVGVPGA